MTRMRPMVVDMNLVDLPESGFYTDETMLTRSGPIWSTSSVGMMFFGHGKNWLRRHVLEGDLLLDGIPMPPPPRTGSAELIRWRLCDVERAVHALAQSGYLDTAQLLRTIAIVRLVAETWGFMSADGTPLVPDQVIARKDYPAVRVWAKANGYKVGKYGWIANSIVTAYLRATRAGTG